ncbi:branched-chain amino acid ABC transporter permease [Parafrankia colletiae]|uniref:Branched-chain amino acid ABC transporter permease n=1 Tax=Parafrankia colletiae TaxID=573497 RepID=A0A1S1RGN7_9ACTN|nr:branched-chain amino acid ABC transporter permease [Parafrankia colletiae]MCK9905032.1 branched-chain amino acid ABC transporter permease [Frankia sp. Cpl3]OHV45370.1 branched-chain amino acid ABC transporter permease [Parafrankia colletiae]
MSDTTTQNTPAAGPGSTAPGTAGTRRALPLRRPAAGSLLLIVFVAVLAVLPFYLEEFWLRTGFAVFGAAIGAIGLNILVGTTGQLSLGHAFFLAVGGISYCWLSGESNDSGSHPYVGLGLPPLVGMVLAVGISGLAGLVFSPIGARLKGLYLGIASLGLVFVGIHVFNSISEVSGGHNGRVVPDFSLFGFTFDDTDPDLYVLNVEFEKFERLWYLGLVLAVGCYLFARAALNGRPGRALRAVRDSEIAASVNGVNVTAYRARAFLLSSMYAGLSGVLFALSIGSVAPESFAIEISVQYLAMIVLGGLGSVGGACAGAAFVTALPYVLRQYAESIPGLSEPGTGGVSYSEAARYAYGAAVILVIVFWPSGLAGITRGLKAAASRRASRQAPT